MKQIKITITLLMTALLVAACSKDKNSGAARGGVGTVPGLNCNGCSSSNRLYTAMGRTGSGVGLVRELFAASNDRNGNPVAVDYSNGSYSGAVDGIGKLFVATGVSCGYGNTTAYLPRGAYNVSVETFGQMDPYTQGIYGMTVVVEGGGYVARMAIDQVVYFQEVAPQLRACDGRDFGTEMIGIWRVLTVNNYQCGNTIAFGGYGTQQNQLMCP